MEEPTLSMSSGEERSASGVLASWGAFRLIEKVGQGAFGEVYRAWDPKLEREVALKLLVPAAAGDDADYKAILREARLMAKVRHPNVVAVHGVDRQEGRVGFWSDFVRGKTLSDLLKAQGSFGAREAALIGIELCRALSAVHAAGLLHRDIKTGNVMREEGGRILLMDFGLTHEGPEWHHGGTPLYMSPELWLGQPASVASDIYALGVLLFHMVTGKYPRQLHESDSQRSLMDERPDLPEQFVRVIETAINRDPKRRFASAGQMLAALSEAMGMGSVSTEAAPIALKRKVDRRWAWLLVLLAALPAYFITPVRNLFTSVRPGIISGEQDDYQKAHDLLDNYYKPHSLDGAIGLFQKTVTKDPKFALGWSGLGRAYWLQYLVTRDSTLIDKAKSASNHALDLDRDLAPAHVTLGMIYTAAGKNDLAAEELNQALRLDSRSAEAYGARAELYAKQGRSDDVEPTLQKAVDLAPEDWRWRNQLGTYLKNTGKLAAAVEQFQRLIQLTPDSAPAYNNLGLAYFQQERFSESQAALEKSIQLGPGYRSLSNLGMILLLEGKYPQAAAMLQQSIKLNPSNYIAWANLASAVQWGLGDKAKARETYLKAIELGEQSRKERPNDAHLLADIGSFYAAVGNPGKSIPLLREASALAPEDAPVLYRVGEGCELVPHRQEALRWIGKALEQGYSLEYIKRSPELAGLRSDPRFAAATSTQKQ